MRDAVERLASISGRTVREHLGHKERGAALYALAAHCRVPGIRPGRILPDRVYRAVLAFDQAAPRVRRH